MLAFEPYPSYPVETGSVLGPSPREVGQLWYELAESFAVGELVAAVADPTFGQSLQGKSAALMADVSQRLGLDVDAPGRSAESGFAGRLVGFAAKAWKWLGRTSKGVLQQASKHGGKLVPLVLAGGAVVTTYDWLNGDEQTRREAIQAERDVGLELVKKIPPSQVEAALARLTGGLEKAAGGGGLSPLWWVLLIGGGLFAAVHFWPKRSGGSKERDS